MSKMLSRLRDVAEAIFGLEIRKNRSGDQKIWQSILAVHDFNGSSRDEADAFLGFSKDRYNDSKAQLLQDLFVLYSLSEKRDGFFVEFGATDGMTLSNTYLLEARYGWTGILSEPARSWHADLKNNRRCAIDFRCVTGASGQSVLFNETPDGVFSTIDSFSGNDIYARERSAGERYEVETVSLNDLLREHGAPGHFDYLSIDTEGSELLILQSMDFAKYTPRIITVEHNFVGSKRSAIESLLGSKGYSKRFAQFSSFDDWYVLQ